LTNNTQLSSHISLISVFYFKLLGNDSHLNSFV